MSSTPADGTTAEDGPAATPLLAPRDGLPPVIETSTALVAYADALAAGSTSAAAGCGSALS